MYRLPGCHHPPFLTILSKSKLYAQMSHSRGKRNLLVGWVYKVENMFLCQLSGSYSILVLNFDTSVLDEATRRARMVTKGTKKKRQETFVTLPVGDLRDDDTPRGFCNNKELNYYHQGKTDVCVLGGLANAVFWMIDLDPAKDLLHNYSPTMDSFWFHFVQHVNGVMHEYGYLLRKLKYN
jgi:hypothetical protein